MYLCTDLASAVNKKLMKRQNWKCILVAWSKKFLLFQYQETFAYILSTPKYIVLNVLFCFKMYWFLMDRWARVVQNPITLTLT